MWSLFNKIQHLSSYFSVFSKFSAISICKNFHKTNVLLNNLSKQINLVSKKCILNLNTGYLPIIPEIIRSTAYFFFLILNYLFLFNFSGCSIRNSWARGPICHSSYQSCCTDNAGFLTHRTTK